MRRRNFITLLGGAAAAWPLATRAQQSGKVPTIGFLGTNETLWSAWTAAFVSRLRQLGRIDGHSVAIEFRWSEGRPERENEIAAEFVKLNVDAIVTSGSAVASVKRATATIPIVFAIANDPVGSGLVASLARPGGNVTGLSNQSEELASKRLQLLREVIPDLRLVTVLFNGSYPAAVLETNEVETASRTLGLQIVRADVHRAEDIESLIEKNRKAGAVYVVVDALVTANRAKIISLARSARLPTLFNTRDFVQTGGLMAYGPNFPDLFRRAAELVDRILRGTKPADIPVEQPTKFELIVNLTTAKALGLHIPEAFLLRTDEVIE
jgi:putative ABC transport system substrate-binding protein